jgi:3-oxoacyl-[acyl-carrier-protein] synthase I
MRPVYISHAGLWCAAGSKSADVRQALRNREVPKGRLGLLQDSIPYGFAIPAEIPFHERLATALSSVGAELDIRELPHEVPIIIGSSSVLIGAAEEAGWPLPPEFTFDLDGLMNAVQQVWKVDNQGWTFSCGCTSGVHALEAAVGLIESGTVDEALVLGVEIRNRTTPAGFSSLQLLASEEARPLDVLRDGMMLSEAVAGVRLTSKPAPWRIHAPALVFDVTNATGHADDGSTIARGMREALDLAGIKPGALRAIKLQAAGSPGADAMEVRALGMVFGDQPPPVLSIKASLGHALGACGIAEMVALLHCGAEGWLPPTAGFRDVDPELGVRPVQEPLQWPQGAVLLDIQGFGGGIASWVVERL